MEICPICQKKYKARPAMSRCRRGVKICPECGMREALDAARDAIFPGLTDAEWEELKDWTVSGCM